MYIQKAMLMATFLALLMPQETEASHPCKKSSKVIVDGNHFAQILEQGDPAGILNGSTVVLQNGIASAASEQAQMKAWTTNSGQAQHYDPKWIPQMMRESIILPITGRVITWGYDVNGNLTRLERNAYFNEQGLFYPQKRADGSIKGYVSLASLTCGNPIIAEPYQQPATTPTYTQPVYTAERETVYVQYEQPRESTRELCKHSCTHDHYDRCEHSGELCNRCYDYRSTRNVEQQPYYYPPQQQAAPQQVVVQDKKCYNGLWLLGGAVGGYALGRLLPRNQPNYRYGGYGYAPPPQQYGFRPTSNYGGYNSYSTAGPPPRQLP